MLIIYSGVGAPDTDVSVPFTRSNNEVADQLKLWEQKPVFLSRIASGKNLRGLLLKINGDVESPSKVAGLLNSESETIRLIDREFQLAIEKYQRDLIIATSKDMAKFSAIESGIESVIPDAALLGVATYTVKAYKVSSSNVVNTCLVPFYAIFGLIIAVAGDRFKEQAIALKASAARELFLIDTFLKENHRTQSAINQIDLRLRAINRSLEQLSDGLTDVKLVKEKEDLLSLKSSLAETLTGIPQ